MSTTSATEKELFKFVLKKVSFEEHNVDVLNYVLCSYNKISDST